MVEISDLGDNFSGHANGQRRGLPRRSLIDGCSASKMFDKHVV